MTHTRLAMIFTVALITAVASAQSDTTFTYQGELRQNGNSANDSFDMTFSLWDAVSGGNQIGTTNVHNGVPVVDGKFKVDLDFGADAFDNSARFLKIVVDGTELAPRQLITRAPYAIQTRGIFVDDAGNVGVGTSDPVAPLEVHNINTGEILRLVSDQSLGYLLFREGSMTRAVLGFGDEADLLVNAMPDSFAINGLSTAIHLAVDSDATKGITIDPNGNVGIGTVSPNYPLHVEAEQGNTAISARVTNFGPLNVGIKASADGALGTGVSGTASSVGVSGYASATSGLNSGVLAISDSTSGRGVDAVGNSSSGVNYAVFAKSNSTEGFDFFAAGAGEDYGSSSSRRWKSNVVEVDQPLKKMTQLRGVYFDWDEEHGGHHDIGMIAEEVGKVLPEIVQYEENGQDAIGMDYSKLTPLLVEAMKELRNEHHGKIVSLQDENDSLRERIDSLEKLVEQLAFTKQKQPE